MVLVYKKLYDNMKIATLILLIFNVSLCFSDDQPIIIVNPEAQVQNLSQHNLLRIYTMQQKRWPNGKKIKVFTLSLVNKTHQRFVKQILKSQPYQLERHWKRLLFSGIGKTPLAINDEQKMLEQVKSTPGAIGYLSHSTQVEPSLILEVK